LGGREGEIASGQKHWVSESRAGGSPSPQADAVRRGAKKGLEMKFKPMGTKKHFCSPRKSSCAIPFFLGGEHWFPLVPGSGQLLLGVPGGKNFPKVIAPFALDSFCRSIPH